MIHDDDDLTAADRRALALWLAPVPPADFEGRLLARLETERAAAPANDDGAAASSSPVAARRSRGSRELAFAALAVVLAGGIFAARILSPSAASGPSAAEVRTMPADGGPAPEANPVGDRVRS